MTYNFLKIIVDDSAFTGDSTNVPGKAYNLGPVQPPASQGENTLPGIFWMGPTFAGKARVGRAVGYHHPRSSVGSIPTPGSIFQGTESPGCGWPKTRKTETALRTIAKRRHGEALEILSPSACARMSIRAPGFTPPALWQRGESFNLLDEVSSSVTRFIWPDRAETDGPTRKVGNLLTEEVYHICAQPRQQRGWASHFRSDSNPSSKLRPAEIRVSPAGRTCRQVTLYRRSAKCMELGPDQPFWSASESTPQSRTWLLSHGTKQIR